MINNLKVKIYADGACLADMIDQAGKPHIKGLTTNPSLMKVAGIPNYKEFSAEVLEKITDLPISFEVFADTLDEMEKEALEINSWGKNVFVKIPVTNSKGVSTEPLIKKLSDLGVKLNVTAIFTEKQISGVIENLNPNTEAIVSIFAGRINDAGFDAKGLIKDAVKLAGEKSDKIEILWASCRQMYSIIEANEIGCHIITVPNALLAKIDLFGKDLEEYSLETVQMFLRDSTSLGYSIL